MDPHYAKAWAALAGAYRILAWKGVDVDKELLRLQGEAARKAVEFDPGLAVAHVRLAQFYGEAGEKSDWKKADEHHRIAMELFDPDEPMLLADMSETAFDEGDIDKAIAIQRRFVTRDPLNPVARQILAVKLLYDLRLDEAMSEYRSVLELSPDVGPDIEIGNSFASMCCKDTTPRRMRPPCNCRTASIAIMGLHCCTARQATGRKRMPRLRDWLRSAAM